MSEKPGCALGLLIVTLSPVRGFGSTRIFRSVQSKPLSFDVASVKPIPGEF